ncbi:hypothetical protein CDAR_278571 [Caerostris darwini]|uniref:Uncharacterized protein n=1 Tax=Caerostris darwini TaxID=1538125 RepID=A0AAV4WR54_9ARAC|nr:hypothetical protein CDAR_278571 [Caerostris darwini]
MEKERKKRKRKKKGKKKREDEAGVFPLSGEECVNGARAFHYRDFTLPFRCQHECHRCVTFALPTLFSPREMRVTQSGRATPPKLRNLSTLGARCVPKSSLYLLASVAGSSARMLSHLKCL